MAKRKRAASTNQRAKENIAAARALVKMGVLSKQTKFHGGKYISQRVLKKVRENEWILKNNEKAIPVSRKYAEKAAQHNIHIIKAGSRRLVVVPNRPREIKLVKQGYISGITHVPGGQHYTVRLPYENMRDLMEAIENGELESFKDPKEEFAFTYFGNMSTRSFRDMKALKEWLMHYDFAEYVDGEIGEALQAAYANFNLYRVMPGKMSPASFQEAQEERRKKQLERQRDADDYHKGRKSRRVADMSFKRAEQIRQRDKERKRKERAALKENDPAEYARILLLNRERAVRSNAKRKAKKAK